MVIATVPASGASPFPGTLPGTPIGMNLPANAEPSDIVWHPRLNELFLVSDNGWLFRMTADGAIVRSWFVGGDLEGLCVARPEKDLIYLAVEVPYRIHEFDFERGIVTRTFDLSPWIQTPSNQGIEALTYIPDSESGAPGRFLVGVQFDGSIHEFDLSIDSTSTHVTQLAAWTPVPGRTDLAAMSYDAGSNLLYLVYDYADLLRAIRPNGDLVNEWQLPGEEQEGIALNPMNCDLFIAEDTGPVWRFADFPASDLDMDRVPDCRDRCPDTPPRSAVDANGCACVQQDDDNDGVDNCTDWCDGTPWPETPDWRGCSCSQWDSDGDGVNNCADACAHTPWPEPPDASGCSCSQRDGDGDGVDDCRDECPSSTPGTRVDFVGCPLSAHPTAGDGAPHEQATGDNEAPDIPR